MAECKDCGISLTYSNSLATERCNKCHGAWLKNSVETNSAENTKSDLVADPMQYLKVKQIGFKEKVTIDAMLLTTSHTLQGIEVTKYLGVVSAECAYGMNMFKDMFANVRNLVGGRSAAVEDTMRDSRETVLLELKRKAYAKGANAVIAVDLDYTQLGAGGNMMVLVTASGTAVIIETEEGAL
jgi:uncharacterized protein YbjQ (UPF0145 family)